MMQQAKNILYLYDLPKDTVTSCKISDAIKEKTGYEISEIPQIKRDNNKEFYTAVIKIEDATQFKDICKKLKYFEIEGKQCRALPYDKDFLGVNRANLAQNNVFIKGIPTDISSEKLDKLMSEHGDIKSLKVALNDRHVSKKYGFVCFVNHEDAKKVTDNAESFEGFHVIPYNPKPREAFRKLFNNIFVKNIPANWDEATLKEHFSQHGNITSCIIKKELKDEVISQYGFVCYGKPNDNEYGIKAA